MIHTHCTRICLEDGSKSFVEFGEIDGTLLGLNWRDGYNGYDALLIVNRWNYIAQLGTSQPGWLYFLHTEKGASC